MPNVLGNFPPFGGAMPNPTDLEPKYAQALRLLPEIYPAMPNLAWWSGLAEFMLDLMTRHIFLCLFIAVACLCLLMGCVMPSSLVCDGCKAIPRKMGNLTGVWIGFDESELDFCRLDLRPDATGYFATVSPADTSLHDYGVQAYRVTHWAVEEWKFTVSLSPATTNAEPIYLRGRCDYTSLGLEIGGTTNQWKRKIVLYPESRIDGANQETRDKIGELQKR